MRLLATPLAFASRGIQRLQNNTRSSISRLALAAACFTVLFGTSSALALTATGIAVGSVTGDTQVGLTEFRPMLNVGDFDGNAIKYFIPLENNGTYGAKLKGCSAGFGTCSDTGDGGGKLQMFLRFSPVSLTEDSILRVIFEDLDLKNANDPVGFLEKLKVQTWNGTNLVDLTPWITEIDGLVTGDNDTQQILELALGTLSTDPLYLALQFKSQSTFKGTNTPEYLIAMVTSPDRPPGGGGEVPLPGAMALFGTVLAGSWGVNRWRRRRVRPGK